MITALISLQTVCIATSAYITYRTTKKQIKMKLVSNEKGFKHYKAGGF
jgi:hypothetical protein